jgi:hypothetical protein
MGSNAVGLNSSIPLDVKTPPPTDPAEQLGRVMALKNAAVTNQLNQGKLQEQQIAIQQAREQQDAQAALNLALKNNGKVDDQGNYTLDADGVTRDLTAAGHGVAALSAKKSLADALKAQVQLKNEQLTGIEKQGAMLGNLADGIKWPDFTVTDPTLRQQQLANFQNTGGTAVALALQNNIIDKDHAAVAAQVLQNPTPDGVDQLKTSLQQGIKFGERAKVANDQITAVLDQHMKQAGINKDNAQLPGEQAKSDKDLQSNASSILSTAESLADYTRKYDKLATDPKYKGVIDIYPKPEELAGGSDSPSYTRLWDQLKATGKTPQFVPTPDERTPKEANDSLTAALPKIRALGQTAEQQQTSAQTATSQGIAQQRADANDKRLDALIAKTGQDKPATKGQFLSVQKEKDAALQKSQQELEKDLKAASLGGRTDPDAFRQAHQDYQARNDAAQSAYESGVSTLTGQDVPHNNWAKSQPIPEPPVAKGKGGGAAPPPAAKPAATPAPASKPAATPSKYQPGQTVNLKGVGKVKIKTINADGTFTYE